MESAGNILTVFLFHPLLLLKKVQKLSIAYQMSHPCTYGKQAPIILAAWNPLMQLPINHVGFKPPTNGPPPEPYDTRLGPAEMKKQLLQTCHFSLS